MLTGEDISDINAGLTKTQKIPHGQHKLLLNVVVQLRPNGLPATKQDPYVASGHGWYDPQSHLKPASCKI